MKDWNEMSYNRYLEDQKDRIHIEQCFEYTKGYEKQENKEHRLRKRDKVEYLEWLDEGGF